MTEVLSASALLALGGGAKEAAPTLVRHGILPRTTRKEL